jgi:hypothetical protein
MPAAVITKPPSAELRPDQKDSDSLPPYDVLDAVLHGLVEEDLSAPRVAARDFDRDMVARVERLLDRVRTQAASGAAGREARPPQLRARPALPVEQRVSHVMTPVTRFAPVRPAASTSATSAPRCTISFGRGGTGASSCCGWTTRTPSVRPEAFAQGDTRRSRMARHGPECGASAVDRFRRYEEMFETLRAGGAGLSGLRDARGAGPQAQGARRPRAAAGVRPRGAGP